jgi:DNA-binding response OmpR family regulator
MRLTPQKTIVVVEDEQDTAEMFAEMMRLSGYRVLKSFGGNAAIELIRRVQPDAVVLDVMMPDMSGLEVLQALRDDGLLDTLPVVVVSAKSMPADIQTGLDAGASVYLTKPVSFTDLKAAVEKLF